MTRGAYGYDAPYALIMFALAALGSLALLVLFLWQRNARHEDVFFLFPLFCRAHV